MMRSHNPHPKYGDSPGRGKKGNGYIRSKGRKHRLNILWGQVRHKGYLSCTVYFHAEKQRLMRCYVLSSDAKRFAKLISNRRVRHASHLPNYGGYRKFYRAMWWFV